MNSSLNLGKIGGIDIKIHLTFFLLIIWVAFSALFAGGTTATVLSEVGFVLILFLCVILHELGHSIVARRFGIHTQDITLLPIGGIARLEKMPDDPKEELLVAAAGPAVNGVIGIAIFVGLLLTGFFAQPQTLTLALNNFWFQLLAANVTLAVFNLIPAFPMDGGRVLRALLATRMNRVKATKIAANVGRGLAILIGLAGFVFNPWLVLTAFFIWSGAGAEAQTVEIKAGLKGLTVRDALISQIYRVEANQSLESVLQLSMQTGQKTLPVTSNGRFLGLIRREDLMGAIDRLGRRAPAYAAIGLEPEGLAPDLPLVEVLPKFTASRVLPVIEDGQLIGIVTPESIQQVMWLNQHQKATGAQPPEEFIHPA